MATITGTAGDDVRDGTIFSDTMKGLDGDDVLSGGRGIDRITGGGGRDELFGGFGDDFFIVNPGDGADGEVYSGGSGFDTFQFIGSTGFAFFDLTDSVLSGMQRILFIGIADSDTILFMNNLQEAGNPDLEIVGSLGTDQLQFDIDLPGGRLDLSDLHLTNWAASDVISIRAGDGDNEIIGSSVSDDISFLDEGDTVQAGAGNDVIDFLNGGPPTAIDGGDGNDTIRIVRSLDLRPTQLTGIEGIVVAGNSSSPVTVNLLAAQFGSALSPDLAVTTKIGIDATLEFDMGAELSFTARQFTFASGFLFGSPSLKVTGDADAETIGGSIKSDTLLGRGGADSLNGNAGNDVLNGGTGADRMAGGSGNDTYIVDNDSDIVSEASFLKDAGGHDSVNSSVSFTLGTFCTRAPRRADSRLHTQHPASAGQGERSWRTRQATTGPTI